MSALRFVIPFGMFAFGTVPFAIVDAKLQAGHGAAAGATEVQAAATGGVAAARATDAGAAKVRVDVSGNSQAVDATSGGTAIGRLLVSGDVQAATATAGGVAKPPAFQNAAKASYGQIHLVEMEALQRSLTRQAISWVIPFGKYPFGMAPNAAPPDSGLVSIALSDKGYASPPTGDQPNTLFLGRVTQALKITRTLALAPEASRRVTIESGQITIANTDGAMDTAADQYSVDGRKVQVKLGLDGYEYGDFKPVFTGRSVTWTPGFDALSVEVRDQSYLLDVELHPEFYSGAGGYNGSAQVAGKPRPICFGKCRNIQPVLVDPALLTYQFHHRAVEAVDAVYDRYVALTLDADYPDYAALAAATVPAAHYSMCLALGVIRLGSSATFVTADVRGDAEGGYADTTGPVSQRLITDFGAFDSDNLDSRLWDAFAGAAPGVIGWYSADPINISDALNQIVGACGGWWGADFNGLFGASILAEPDPANVIFEFDQSHFQDISPVAPPSGTFPPRWRQRVGYQHNWTTMSGEDIAGAVSDADRAFLAEDSRLVTSTSDQTRTESLTAMDPDPIQSLFDAEADAQEVSDRILDLLSKPRRTYHFPISLVGYMAPVGSTVKITHPRVAKGAGWLARVIDAEIDAAAQQVTLMVWG